jgi:hypothetical protein
VSVWVYLLGEKSGANTKIGHSKDSTMRERLRTVNGEQMTDDEYVLLVSIHGTTKDETYLKDHFADLAIRKGRRTEYFQAHPRIIEYANWLRSQWWSSVSLDDQRQAAEMPDPDLWLPESGRSISAPPIDALKIVQDYEDPADPLYNTAWSWMVAQKAGVQDYFTPPELVDAARAAMGGIDLDAASHPLANRTHKIPDYFHTGRSAFDNDWHGRVWLNPPYGNNAPWFERAIKFIESGDVSHFCMLSPMWAFQTRLAEPLMALASGVVLLSPTPKFWGNKDPDKTGSNLPHGIVYVGPHSDHFYAAFAPFGFPMQPLRIVQHEGSPA